MVDNIISENVPTFHPSGIIPSSESTNLPSLNGSKSTNQDLNKACACCSKLSFIRRLSSILSSSDFKKDTIPFITLSRGTGISKSLNAPNEIYGCDEPLLSIDNCCLPFGEVK